MYAIMIAEMERVMIQKGQHEKDSEYVQPVGQDVTFEGSPFAEESTFGTS